MGTAVVLLSCGAYFFSEDQTLDAKQAKPQTVQPDTMSNTVLIDTTNIAKPRASIEQKEINSVPVRFYSHTFLSTEDYEASSRFGKLPTHMSDVRIEELAFDEHGALIIDEQIKYLIEFFLLAKDSEGQEQAIERLNEYLEMTLQSPAKEQALVISEQYLAYKENLLTRQFSDNTKLSDEANLSEINLALEARKKVRRQYLGEANSQAIFGYAENYDDFSFQRLEINANTDLSAAEKDRLIAQEEQKLPKELAEKMRYKRESKNLQQKISELKKNQGNQAEIFELRKDFYGVKVADRLEYLEDQSPLWQQRMNDYFQEQLTIQSNHSLTDKQKQQKIKALKNQSFTYKEQIKMAVQQIRG